MRAEVDQGTCVGSGWCVNIAAPAFELDEAGKATFDPKADVSDELLYEAEDNCPVSAITIVPGPEDEHG